MSSVDAGILHRIHKGSVFDTIGVGVFFSRLIDAGSLIGEYDTW